MDIYTSSLALYIAGSWKELLAYRAALALYIWRLLYAYQLYRNTEFRLGNWRRLAVVLSVLG